MTLSPQPPDKRAELKRDIIIELTNAYYESYRYDRPNDTYEQLGAFCRDLATNDVEELLAAEVQAARLSELEMLKKVPIQDMSKAVTAHISRRCAELQPQRKEGEDA